jgi:hypothetical protein
MDERERAGLTWALHDLDDLRARGTIDAHTYEVLRADYDARLRKVVSATSGAPTQGTLPLDLTREPVHQAAYVAPALLPALGEAPAASLAVAMPSPSTGTAGVPPSLAAPRHAPGERTGLWINLTLFLGAFFVVIASLIFVGGAWQSLGARSKALFMGALTLAFIVGGLVCLRLPRVRPAGQTFLAIGALLLPLDGVGAYTLLLRGQLSGATTLALGAAICALFYGALALSGVGWVYAGAGIAALTVAWGSAIVASGAPGEWFGPLALLLPPPLLFGARLAARTARGRATLREIPAWSAQILLPFAAVPLILALSNAAPPPLLVGLALIGLFYVGAALTQPRPTIRGLHVAGASVAGAFLILALGWQGGVEARDYAALLLGGAWLALLAMLGLRRAGTAWATGAFAVELVGWVQLGCLLVPWGFFVPDGASGYWAALFGGAFAFVGLHLWGLRRPWLIQPLTLAGALFIFHLLRVGPSPGPYGYAWTYTLAALVPVLCLQPLRRGGARHQWDWHLIATGQALALGAAITAAVAGNRFQTAAILWLFVLVGAAIAASEQQPRYLILPNLWVGAAILATVALSGAGQRWAPSFYAGLGLLVALGLQGWRGVPTLRRDDWFMAHRWSAGIWAGFGAFYGFWLLVGGLGAFLATGNLHELVLDSAYGPVGLAVSLCGVALAADAFMTLRRPTGYSASAVIMLAVLMGLARIDAANPQAYAIPLGLYLLALATYVAYERDLGPIRMPAANALLAGATIVILGTTFVQSLAHPWRYIFLGLAEGLILLGMTAFLRRRYGVAISLLFVTLTALRAVFDAARALPNWAIIGLLGLALLAVALVILLGRDRFEAWGNTMSTRWSRLS